MTSARRNSPRRSAGHVHPCIGRFPCTEPSPSSARPTAPKQSPTPSAAVWSSCDLLEPDELGALELVEDEVQPRVFREAFGLVDIIPALVADSLEIRNAIGYLQVRSPCYAPIIPQITSPGPSGRQPDFRSSRSQPPCGRHAGRRGDRRPGVHRREPCRHQPPANGCAGGSRRGPAT